MPIPGKLRGRNLAGPTWAEVSREYASFEPFMSFMKKLLLEAEHVAAKKRVSVGA